MQPQVIEIAPYNKHQKLYALEGLRFALSLAVVFWHYYYYGPLAKHINQPTITNHVFSFFSFAVEAFFIVSGLVIVFSTESKSAKDFIVQRFLRLAPALFICSTMTLCVCLISTALIAANFDIQTLISNYFTSIFVIPLVRFQGIDGSSWSLRFEIRFYILIFIFMLLFNISKNIKLVITFFLFLNLLFIPFDVLSIPPPPLLSFARSAMGVYGVYFALGMIIYAIKKDGVIKFNTFALLTLGLIFSSYCTWIEANRMEANLGKAPIDFSTGLIISTSLFLVVYVFSNQLKVGNFKTILIRLGAMSYPLYLLHQTAGYEIINLLAQYDHGLKDPRIVVVSMMLIASYLISKYTEPYLHTFFKSITNKVFYTKR